MTDVLIHKYTTKDGRWCAYYLRKNGTIHYKQSNGAYARKVTPDSLVGIVTLKRWSGKEYLNVDALKKATGIVFI